MITSHHIIDTKTAIIDKQLLVAQRSTEDSEQIDVFYFGKLIAYVVVEDDSLEVCEIESNLSKDVVVKIKSISEDLLTQELIESANRESYSNYYAAKNSEQINIYS